MDLKKLLIFISILFCLIFGVYYVSAEPIFNDNGTVTMSESEYYTLLDKGEELDRMDDIKKENEEAYKKIDKLNKDMVKLLDKYFELDKENTRLHYGSHDDFGDNTEIVDKKAIEKELRDDNLNRLERVVVQLADLYLQVDDDRKNIADELDSTRNNMHKVNTKLYVYEQIHPDLRNITVNYDNHYLTSYLNSNGSYDNRYTIINVTDNVGTCYNISDISYKEYKERLSYDEAMS